jgi:phospholipid transport system substrate-binding protein
MKPIRFSLLMLMVAIALIAQPVRADQTTDGAVDFIETLGSKAINDLTGTSLSVEEREVRFRALLNEHFDMAEISRFVLGRYWRVATDEEKAEFARLFEEFLVKSYAVRFAGYSGESFRVLGGSDPRDGVVIVNCRIERSGAEPIRLDWRVTIDGSKLAIIDLLVEGVSMAVTQRSDFASVIQSRGGKVKGLLDALRSKIGESS